MDILQDRALSMGHRMVLLGLAIKALTELDWARPDVEGWARRFGALAQSGAAAEELNGLSGDRRMFLNHNMAQLVKLLGDRPVWVSGLLKTLGTDISRKQDSERVLQVDCDSAHYEELEAAFRESLGELDWFWENLTVAVLWHLMLPTTYSKDALWRSYVTLCDLYSFYRFTAVVGSSGKPTKERLFHNIVMVSRALLHNGERRELLRDEFFQNDSATLAHMAILVSG